MTAARLHHRFDGDPAAPVVVLSSSLGTTLELWEPQLPALTRGFRVLRYDHPGHGRSPLPTGPLDLGGDVFTLLDELGLERVSFCGLSLGGLVGMWLASGAPERVERLVLACTSPRFATPEFWLERAAVVRRDGVEAIADVVLERWFTAAFRAAQPAIVQRHREMLVSTPPEGYARCCEVLAAWDLRERVGEIVAPTLVLGGADDPAVPSEDTELLGRTIPRARVVVLPQAAHLANVEHAEAFTRAVVDHLSGREAEAA